MKIKVNSKSPAKRTMLFALAKLYAKLLNIENSKFSLVIDTVKDFRKSAGLNGAVCLIDTRVIALALDSKLNIEQILITLAHEMVHVKQRARGQLKYYTDHKGKTVCLWMGKRYKTEYYDSPWEIEAFSRERVLANKVSQLLIKD